MAQISRIRLVATTDGAGAATVTSADPVTGYVAAIKYVKDAMNELGNNAVATFTGETSGIAIDTETIPTGGSFEHYPRAATQDQAGATSLYAAAGQSVRDKVPLAFERIKLVIASGGAAKTGTFDIFIEGVGK